MPDAGKVAGIGSPPAEGRRIGIAAEKKGIALNTVRRSGRDGRPRRTDRGGTDVKN